MVPLEDNYPLSQFDAQWNLARWVRVNCVFANQTAGICANTPTGGSFTKGSAAAITMQVMISDTGVPEQDSVAAAAAASSGGSLTIRYTLDGSDPTPGSATYPLGGLPLSPLGTASVHVRAMAWLDGVATGQVTDVTYSAQ